MTKLTRKLMISVLSLAFAIVALGTTTFAWFTMNATAKASITVSIDGGSSGILISKGDGEWASSTTLTTSSTLTPITYVAGASTLASSDTFTNLKEQASTAYLQFSLFLTGSVEAGADLFLSASGNTMTNSTIAGYKTLKSFTYSTPASTTVTKGSTVKVDAINAMRCVMDVNSFKADLEAAQGDVSLAGVNQLFTDGGGTDSRLNTVLKYTGIETNADNNEYNYGDSLALTNAANSYYASVNGEDSFVKTPAVVEPETPAVMYGANANYNAITPVEANAYATALGQVALDKVTKVTFTYWLEGFDADCFDAVMRQTVGINLSFTTTR